MILSNKKPFFFVFHRFFDKHFKNFQKSQQETSNMESDEILRKLVQSPKSKSHHLLKVEISTRTPTPPRKVLSISSMSRKKRRSTSSKDSSSKRRRLMSETCTTNASGEEVQVSSMSGRKQRSASSEARNTVSSSRRRRLLSETDVGETKKRQVKNPKKWRGVEKWGKPIRGKILPMKLLNDLDDTNHTVSNLKTHWPKLHTIVDLQNDQWSYSVGNVPVKHVPLRFGTLLSILSFRKTILKLELRAVSKKCPSEHQVASFIKIMRELVKEEGQVAVHCHYGFNRTGFLIVCFMVEVWNMSVHDAIRTFSEHRSPGIKHEHFMNELIKRYGGWLWSQRTTARMYI